MKKLRIVSLILLVISVFISIDFGLNVLYNLIPEFLDGYTSHSVLQGTIGIFGDSNWYLGKFYEDFEISIWISFSLFVENIVLAIMHIKKDK